MRFTGTKTAAYRNLRIASQKGKAIAPTSTINSGGSFVRKLGFVATFVAYTKTAIGGASPQASFLHPKFGQRQGRLFSSMNDKEFDAPKHVIIAGAGVIGISTAYFLQKNHNVHSITLIDRTGTIAPAASGKAGGFLALDWNDHSYTGQLTRRSFALHQELANELDASTIQYRRLTCAAVSVDPYQSNRVRRPSGKKLDGVEWAEPTNTDKSAVLGMQSMGDTSSIAQVHPKKLCERMWEEICQNTPHTKIVKGTVTGAVHNENDGRLTGARLAGEEESIVTGDALLFSCGPWTADFVKGVKYHSVVVPTETVLTQCVFFCGCGDPEVYVRPDSTAYCTGFPEPERTVTEPPGQEIVRPDKISTILEAVRDASGHKIEDDSNKNTDERSAWALDIQNPIVEQACYLPTTFDNIPVMGRIPKEISGGKGCYIATGHGCWGILLGPASGESMSNLIMTGNEQTPHVNLAPFDPARIGGFQLVGL